MKRLLLGLLLLGSIINGMENGSHNGNQSDEKDSEKAVESWLNLDEQKSMTDSTSPTIDIVYNPLNSCLVTALGGIPCVYSRCIVLKNNIACEPASNLSNYSNALKSIDTPNTAGIDSRMTPIKIDSYEKCFMGELLYTKATGSILRNNDSTVSAQGNKRKITKNTQKNKNKKQKVTIKHNKANGMLQKKDYFNIVGKGKDAEYTCKLCGKFKRGTLTAANKHLHRNHVED